VISMNKLALSDIDVAGKRVLMRVDFNVPQNADGTVRDDTRIRAALQSINYLRERGAKLILMSHLGRPKKVKGDPDKLALLRMDKVAEHLHSLLGPNATVVKVDDIVGPEVDAAVAALSPGDVLLLENTRFNPGEEANDPAFAAQLAALGQLYVNDAFSAAHRAHASTEGLAHHLPAFAGESMRRELEALDKALGTPVKPVLGIVGGSKVSTKLDLLQNLVTKLDRLAIGGGMANTFLHAQGYDVGQSLCEKDLAATALRIMEKAEASGCAIILPVDVVIATKFAAHAPSHAYGLDALPGEGMILDAGPQSVKRVRSAIDDAATLVWNGPLGAFELTPFDHATVAAAKHAAARTREGKLVSVAGGGDTVSALNHAHAADDFSYVSTAGGAFLEWMEGKELPGVAALAK